MSASPSASHAGPWDDPRSDPRRWVFAGLAALLVLIGVSILVAVLDAGPDLARWGSWSVSPGDAWGWILALVIVLLVVWIFVTAIRAVLWGLGVGSLGHRHGRRYVRWGVDPAYAIARERYARGELNREQFEQMVSDLDRRARAPYG